MKIFKLLAILFLLFGIVRFSDENISADNQCQQTCSNNYTACLQDDQDQWDTCVQYVLANQYTCEVNAENGYQSCLSYCGAPTVGCAITACCDQCWDRKQDALENCLNASLAAGQACDNASVNRQAICQSQYNACVNNCPP